MGCDYQQRFRQFFSDFHIVVVLLIKKLKVEYKTREVLLRRLTNHCKNSSVLTHCRMHRTGGPLWAPACARQLYNNFEKNQETRTRRTKKGTPPQKSQKMSLGPYDKIKKCSDCHPESSHTCKNSSRRTPRFKNLNFLFFVQITFTCTC